MTKVKKTDHTKHWQICRDTGILKTIGRNLKWHHGSGKQFVSFLRSKIWVTSPKMVEWGILGGLSLSRNTEKPWQKLSEAILSEL